MPIDSNLDSQQASVDLIFTLAGARIRKIFSWELFEQGGAKRLMLSTGRFELRKFALLPVSPKPDLIAMAQPIPAKERHCCVLFEAGEAQVIWVRKERLGTMTEIEFLARWLRENPEIETVTIVSSGYHLRRVRLCCLFLLPAMVQVKYVGVPNEKIGFVNPVLDWGKLGLYAAVLGWRRMFGKL